MTLQGQIHFSKHLKLPSIEDVVVKSVVTIEHLYQIKYGLQDGDLLVLQYGYHIR